MTTYLNVPPSGESPYWGAAVLNAGDLPVIGVLGESVFVISEAALYYWDGDSWELYVDGTADVSGPASATDNALALFNGTSGKVIKAASAITASRALVSNASGVPVAATTTATEIGYVNGVTSAIQTQLNAKEPTITVLPIAKGGTNSGAALANDLVMRSAAGAVVESGVTLDSSNNLGTTARINAGTAKVGATGAATTSATLEVAGTTGAFLLPRLTTVERDALTATNGLCLYNTSTDKPQCYVAGAWVDLIGWGS